MDILLLGKLVNMAVAAEKRIREFIAGRRDATDARELNAMLDEIRALKTELEQLRGEEQEDAHKVVKGEAYYLETDGPFCIPCWDGKRRKMRLLGRGAPGISYCPTCKTQAFTDRRAYDAHMNPPDESDSTHPWFGGAH